MNYLITGSSGYIGSQVVNRLIYLDKTEKIIGLYHRNKPEKKHHTINYIQSNISDPTFCNSLPKDIDVIIHCAALVKDFGSKKKFYNVNVKGPERLVRWAMNENVSQFVHIGHIQYESNTYFNYYSETKTKIETILSKYIQDNDVPITIIRPGNVFGPGAPLWLIRIIKLICDNKLYLVDSGNGIFHHTYIDNLLDAIELVIGNKKAIGESFNITDGDDSITFKKYFSDIAEILGKSKNFHTISKKNAIRIGTCMILLHKLIRIKPLLTPLAVEILANKKNISIRKAERLLNFHPSISYEKAIKEIEYWINNEYFSK